MGFFEATAASLFQQTSDGRTVFRPFGRLWGTFLVSDEREAHLRAWQRRYYIAGFAAIVVSVHLWQWRAMWAAPVLVAALCVKYWHFARTLPHTNAEPVRVKRSEMFATHASLVGTRLLLPATVGSALFLAIGIWMCIAKPGRDAYFVAGFFGLCTVVNGLQLFVARRTTR